MGAIAKPQGACPSAPPLLLLPGSLLTQCSVPVLLAGRASVDLWFSVLVAFAGCAGFVLVLALVQQVVLDANLSNVKRGGRVIEEGHVRRNPEHVPKT